MPGELWFVGKWGGAVHPLEESETCQCREVLSLVLCFLSQVQQPHFQSQCRYLFRPETERMKCFKRLQNWKPNFLFIHPGFSKGKMCLLLSVPVAVAISRQNTWAPCFSDQGGASRCKRQRGGLAVSWERRVSHIAHGEWCKGIAFGGPGVKMTG